MGKGELRTLPQPSPEQVAEWDAEADVWWETRGQYLSQRQPARSSRAPSLKAKSVGQRASVVVPALWQQQRPGIGYSHGWIPNTCTVHNRLLTWRESQANACAWCEPAKFGPLMIERGRKAA